MAVFEHDALVGLEKSEAREPLRVPADALRGVEERRP